MVVINFIYQRVNENNPRLIIGYKGIYLCCITQVSCTSNMFVYYKTPLD